MMREHFQLILDGLDIGLDSATEAPGFQFNEVLTDLPVLIEGLPPPTAVRAIVTIDGIPYSVTVCQATELKSEPYPKSSECKSSVHGKHTPVMGRCIGCGEVV